ncbi:hypothetical protein BVX94_00145 [bacterium B17]|nr:hypothetical protein BVX94_00145 [bacterium B17]
MHKYKKHIRQGALKGRQEAHLASIIQFAYSKSTSPVLIAIGGPGGTGKSTLARALNEELPNSSLLRLDDYKTARHFRAERNIYGPHPDANKMELIHEHLQSIKKGETFNKPVYCKEQGATRETEPFTPQQFNIIDGETSTYKEFRDLIDLSIFVDSDWKTQLNTRISRDVDERNYSTDKAIATFLHSNLREFNDYGADSKKWADIHIYCHDDYRLEIESIAESLYDQLGDALTEQMTQLDLSGLIVPVPTPFDGDMKVHEKALIEHLEFLAEHGVARVLINGTTAEFFSLLPEERRTILSIARRYFPGVIVFNTASDSLAQSLQAGRWAEDYGADAIASMTPYYYAGVSESGLIKYFNAIAEAIDLPLLIYNFAKHTGNPITAEILRNVPHFGVKDSSADYSLIKATPNYFAGSSKSMVEAYEAGAIGFVSAEANHIPELYVELEALLKDAKMDQSVQQQELIRSRCTAEKNSILNIKTEISKQIPGYPAICRLPL